MSTWRQRVQPVIDAQDARETFDMRTYGQRILQRLSQLSVADGADAAAASSAAPQQQPLQEQASQPSPQQPAKRKKGRKAAALQQKAVHQQEEQQPAQRQHLQMQSQAPLAAAIGDPEQWQVSR